MQWKVALWWIVEVLNPTFVCYSSEDQVNVYEEDSGK